MWSLIMEKHIPDYTNFGGVAAQDNVSISGFGPLALRLQCRGLKHLLFANLFTTEALLIGDFLKHGSARCVGKGYKTESCY